MNSEQFREAAKDMVQYISNYHTTVQKRRVLPNAKPGQIVSQLPTEPPQKPESWCDIMKDLDKIVMPGLTHWIHPGFFAYFPTAVTYPAILAEMLTGVIGGLGTSWESCPVAVELEPIVTDWLGRALGLPGEFISTTPGSNGGGAVLSAASEGTLMSVLAARTEAFRFIHANLPQQFLNDNEILPKLVMYTSKEAHSSVEKAAMIALVQFRILDVDETSALRGPTLLKAIQEDIEKGFFPFCVVATFGSTGTTSFDNLMEIGPIVRNLPCCWLHCDGAYGASSCICPEMRADLEGIEYADSFVCNPNKWLLTNFESTTLWVRDKAKLARAVVPDSTYLDRILPNYRHYGIPFGKRFKTLKMWINLRSHGRTYLQEYIRNHCRLAKYFESLVRTDDRFEVTNTVTRGLVCFRLVGPDEWTGKLLDIINNDGRLHMIPAMVHNKYSIRVSINNGQTDEKPLDFCWALIQKFATRLLKDAKAGKKLELSDLSFTEEVPTAVFDARRNSLQNIANPVPFLKADYL